MWWKILIAVLCLIYFVSPVDLSALHFGIDDIAALVGSISSIVSAVKCFTDKKSVSDNTDNIKY